MSAETNIAFGETQIGSLSLRNRFIKTATYEGMTPRGLPTSRLADFHAKIARGGVALNTIAYGAIHPDGRTHEDQLLIDNKARPGLKQVADAIHREGGKASMQLTHCGYFTRNKNLTSGRPLSASRSFNAYGLMAGAAFSRAMTAKEIKTAAANFAEAADHCLESGFDAIEIHMGHGYLLSQFLTPSVNRRSDDFGGSVRNRARFPEMVLNEVYKVTQGRAPVVVKINMSDGFEGGVQPEDAIEYIRIFEQAGADAFVLSGSYTSKTPFYLMRGGVPLRGMVAVEKNLLQKAAITLFGPMIMKRYAFEENYFLPLAKKIRSAVDAVLVYQGGVVSGDGVHEVINEGFDLIGLGRALIHNPAFITCINTDPNYRSPCDHCNGCMVEMDKGGVRCVHHI